MIRAPVDFLRENVQRYRQLIHGERPSHAPFRLWLDHTFICQFTGIDPARYLNDFETMLEAQRRVNERFFDLRDYTVDVDVADLYFDREKFTVENPQAPRNRFLGRRLDDFDRYYSRRRLEDTAGVRQLAAGIAFFNQRLPPDKQVGHYLGVPGAMDLFSIFRGTEHFFLDLYDHPATVRRIFSYITERSLAWMEYVENTWGGLDTHSILFDKLDIGEDYCAYLPPDLFDDFVIPFTGALFERYKGKALCSLHTDGDIIPKGMGQLGTLPIDELMGFSPNMDIRDFRKALPHLILGGNIHPIRVMNEGRPEDVKAAARYCFENANQDGRFVLCTGGAIGAGAKPENIDAFLEAAWEVVRY